MALVSPVQELNCMTVIRTSVTGHLFRSGAPVAVYADCCRNFKTTSVYVRWFKVFYIRTDGGASDWCSNDCYGSSWKFKVVIAHLFKLLPAFRASRFG